MVVDQDGNVLAEKPLPVLALLKAQDLALDYGEEVIFYVERHTLFGPKAELHTVIREENGTVLTYTNPED